MFHKPQSFPVLRLFNNFYFLCEIFWCVSHSFSYVTHFVFSRDVWIGTQFIQFTLNNLFKVYPLRDSCVYFLKSGPLVVAYVAHTFRFLNFSDERRIEKMVCFQIMILREKHFSVEQNHATEHFHLSKNIFIDLRCSYMYSCKNYF